MNETVEIPLKKSQGMIELGYADTNARVFHRDAQDALKHEWSLVFRWGKKNKALAAETYIDGKKIQLHRFVCFGAFKPAGIGKFVIPKDGNALNADRKYNLESLTKEELDARKKAKGGVKTSREKLNEEDQKWLDDECRLKQKSRWQVIGELIREKRGALPAPEQPDEFA